MKVKFYQQLAGGGGGLSEKILYFIENSFSFPPPAHTYLFQIFTVIFFIMDYIWLIFGNDSRYFFKNVKNVSEMFLAFNCTSTYINIWQYINVCV